ncbi:hypothetical protein OROMI_007037 [Orobanche minor]
MIRQFHSYLFTSLTISGHKGTAKSIAQARVPTAFAGKDSLDLNGQILGLFCSKIQVGYIFYRNKATKVYKKLVCLKSKKNTRQNSKRGCCLGICERKSKNIDQYEKKLDNMEGNMRTEQRSVAGKTATVLTDFGTATALYSIDVLDRNCISAFLPKRIPELLAVAVPGHFVLIYYGLGYIIYRNQLLNGYAPKFETGLVYWGLVLTKQFPTLVTHQESLESKVNETKATVKFQLKKGFCMGVAVGNSHMEEQLFQNIQMSVNFLVSLLKKNWKNLRCLSLKSTMGKMQRIFREPFLCVLEF